MLLLLCLVRRNNRNYRLNTNFRFVINKITNRNTPTTRGEWLWLVIFLKINFKHRQNEEDEMRMSNDEITIESTFKQGKRGEKISQTLSMHAYCMAQSTWRPENQIKTFAARIFSSCSSNSVDHIRQCNNNIYTDCPHYKLYIWYSGRHHHHSFNVEVDDIRMRVCMFTWGVYCERHVMGHSFYTHCCVHSPATTVFTLFTSCF